MIELSLSYNDVRLKPQFNNIDSRLDPDQDLSTRLTTGVKMDMPLLSANMDSVIGTELAEVMIKNGGVPIFHRFTTLEQKKDWIKKFPDCFISCGIKEQDYDELKILIKNGLKGVCFDVAHSHCKRMLTVLNDMKQTFKDSIQIIAGNVCTKGGYTDLVNAGADAVKVGIGPGSCCSTRNVTGFGEGQFTAVYECGKEARKYGVPIIADGGIQGSKDVVLALAAGASSVMIGSLFAATEESAAEKRGSTLTEYIAETEAATMMAINYKAGGYIPEVKPIKPREAKYRGQASADFQDDFFGGVKKGTVPEGTDSWIPVTGSAQDVIDNLLGGLRSGLTYGGARRIKELQRKSDFIRITR